MLVKKQSWLATQKKRLDDLLIHCPKHGQSCQVDASGKFESENCFQPAIHLVQQLKWSNLTILIAVELRQEFLCCKGLFARAPSRTEKSEDNS